MLNILKRIAAGAFVLGMLVVAVAQSRSEPQGDVEPPTVNPQPVASYMKPVEMPTYNPSTVKPQGYHKRMKLYGHYCDVYFASKAEADAVLAAAKPKRKASGEVVMQGSGNCANGQCSRGGRKGKR